MNRSSCSNTKKGPTKDYNAFKDFHESETSAHILAAWMHFSGIHKIEGLKKVICQQNFNSSIMFTEFYLLCYQKTALPLISIFSLMATTIGIDSLLKKSVVIVKLV